MKASATYDLMFSTVWPQYLLFMQPPDIANATEYAQFNEFIDRLETLPGCNGPDMHFYWMRDYVNWYTSDDEDAMLSYDRLPQFLETQSYELYNSMVNWRYNGLVNTRVADDDTDTWNLTSPEWLEPILCTCL